MRTSRLHQVPGGAIEDNRADAAKDETKQETKHETQDETKHETKQETKQETTLETQAATKDVADDATNEAQLWIVDAGEGQLHLVRGVGALKALIAERGLAKTAPVYMLSTISRTLGEVTEIQSAFESEPDADPTHAEPAAEAARAELPVRAAEPAAEAGPAEPSSQVRDDEFALFDRPFDDGEYFEDSARSRWVRPAGMAAVLIVLGAGGYGLFHSRSVPRSPAGVREHESPTVAVAAPPVEPAAVVAAAPPAPAAPGRPSSAAVVAVADPTAPEPAGPAPAAEQPVAAPAAALRPYPELVAEGERQFQQGHGRKAQALFEEALAETPEGTAALVGLGYVQLDRGKVPLAIALFQRALVQDRGDPTALFGLAESYRQQGNRSAALDAFQKFLTLRPTGNDADIARQLVQELTSGG